MNCKDTEPYMSSFLYNWPVSELFGIVFNRFYRLKIHSIMVCIFDPACELLPPWTKELYSTEIHSLMVGIFHPACVLLPLYLLSDLPPPSPFPVSKYSIYIQCVAERGGWGVLNCAVDHILQEFSTLLLTSFRTYKIASPPQTKKTSKDDIKGTQEWEFFWLRFWILFYLIVSYA